MTRRPSPEALREAAEARLAEIEAERDKLREALRFYAEGEWPEDYPGGVLYAPDDHYEKTYLDYGDRARAALNTEAGHE